MKKLLTFIFMTLGLLMVAASCSDHDEPPSTGSDINAPTFEINQGILAAIQSGKRNTNIRRDGGYIRSRLLGSTEANPKYSWSEIVYGWPRLVGDPSYIYKSKLYTGIYTAIYYHFVDDKEKYYAAIELSNVLFCNYIIAAHDSIAQLQQYTRFCGTDYVFSEAPSKYLNTELTLCDLSSSQIIFSCEGEGVNTYFYRYKMEDFDPVENVIFYPTVPEALKEIYNQIYPTLSKTEYAAKLEEVKTILGI